jgi:hypothetical protein
MLLVAVRQRDIGGSFGERLSRMGTTDFALPADRRRQSIRGMSE